MNCVNEQRGLKVKTSSLSEENQPGIARYQGAYRSRKEQNSVHPESRTYLWLCIAPRILVLVDGRLFIGL